MPQYCCISFRNSQSVGEVQSANVLVTTRCTVALVFDTAVSICIFDDVVNPVIFVMKVCAYIYIVGIQSHRFPGAIISV